MEDQDLIIKAWIVGALEIMFIIYMIYKIYQIKK